MREEQVAELYALNKQLLLKSKLPEYCRQECSERSTHCAAGWVLEGMREAKNLREYPERYSDQQIRIIGNEATKLEPQLLKKANECIEGIDSNDGPIIISLTDLDILVDFVQPDGL